MWLVFPAWAAVVPRPPDGATEVAVLLCPKDPSCSDERIFVDHDPRFSVVPVVLVDGLLAQDVATAAEGERAANAFRDGLARAREEFGRKRWELCEFALDDAVAALGKWRGTPANQELFDLYFLRGAVNAAQKYSGSDRFQQAVAMAWNRPVTLPMDWEPYAGGYYDALRDLVAQPPGRLAVTGPGVYALDGVELGAGPVTVDLLPGVHRLTARDGAKEWRADVVVVAGRPSTARVRFASHEDEREISEGLGDAVDRRVIKPDLAEMVARWADAHGVRTVRFVLTEAVPNEADPAAAPLYTVREATYDPRLRRFGG